jgi:hypothetical protein
MIYLYAILDEPVHLPPLPGLEDATVETREADGLTVAVSEHQAQPDLSNDAVLRHAQVVEALSEAGAAILPARLGVAFADEASLHDAVAGRQAELSAALDRVRGCAEIGLRVLSPEAREQPEGGVGGGEYMRARLRQATHRERLAEALHDALRSHARDSTQRAHAGGRLLLDAAYLVPHAGVDAFAREVRKLEQSHPELALVCTGPWPPYSFAPAAEAAP